MTERSLTEESITRIRAILLCAKTGLEQSVEQDDRTFFDDLMSTTINRAIDYNVVGISDYTMWLSRYRIHRCRIDYAGQRQEG